MQNRDAKKFALPKPDKFSERSSDAGKCLFAESVRFRRPVLLIGGRNPDTKPDKYPDAKPDNLPEKLRKCLKKRFSRTDNYTDGRMDLSAYCVRLCCPGLCPPLVSGSACRLSVCVVSGGFGLFNPIFNQRSGVRKKCPKRPRGHFGRFFSTPANHKTDYRGSASPWVINRKPFQPL